jgi:hypothetical protein
MRMLSIQSVKPDFLLYIGESHSNEPAFQYIASLKSGKSRDTKKIHQVSLIINFYRIVKYSHAQ